MTRPTITAALSLLLLTGCGGGAPKAAAPTPAPTPQSAATPAPAAPAGGEAWGTLALAGSSMLNENPAKACELIRQAAQLRAAGQVARDEAETAANHWGAEALATHGPRCGVP